MKKLVITLMVAVFLSGCDSKTAPSVKDSLIYKNIMHSPGAFTEECKKACGEATGCKAIKDDLIRNWASTCFIKEQGKSVPVSCSSYQKQIEELCPTVLDERFSGV